MSKETTKGKEYEYWHFAWMIEYKVRGMYLGGARKLDAEVASGRPGRRRQKLWELYCP